MLVRSWCNLDHFHRLQNSVYRVLKLRVISDAYCRRNSGPTNSAISLEDPDVSVNVGQGNEGVLGSNPLMTAYELSTCLSRRTSCLPLISKANEGSKILATLMFTDLVDGVTLANMNSRATKTSCVFLTINSEATLLRF